MELLCKRCGQPATHVHFVEWVEDPDRVELMCDDHEPSGADSEWFTVAEVLAGDYLPAILRAPVRPDALVEALALPAAPAPEPGQPLTVRQAAEREQISRRTIDRWLAEGTLGDGAWKVGGTWRIAPEALDAQRMKSKQPAPAAPSPARKPKATKPAAAAIDAELGW